MKNFIFKKSLGQNFLWSEQIAKKIVFSAGNLKDKNVLEIGSGSGIMTKQILFSDPLEFNSVEIDQRCIEILNQQFPNITSKFKLIHGDGLLIEEETLFNVKKKIIIIANLPYSVGTLFLFKWIEKIENFEKFIVMLQKEVVLRIVAKPGSSNYGRLSVMIQALCNVRKLFEVGPEYFKPRPKVDSSVVLIIPKENLLNQAIYNELSCLVKCAFNQRRKMLRGSLKNWRSNAEEILTTLKIDSKKRAEEISVEQFIKIAEYTTLNPI